LIISLIIIHRAHKIQFCRVDYGEHLPLQRYEKDLQDVPQKAIYIQSGMNRLKGTMFGYNESGRLLVISSGHRCPTEDYFEYVRFFIQRGWMVFCYDYTGYHSSEGVSSIDYIQVSGTKDEYYGGLSSIYKHKDCIKNPKCRYMLMDKSGKNGHYDYLLSDEAIELRAKCPGEEIIVENKQLYSAINIDLFEKINSFLDYSQTNTDVPRDWNTLTC
jgi:hypothetical protein